MMTIVGVVQCADTLFKNPENDVAPRVELFAHSAFRAMAISTTKIFKTFNAINLIPRRPLQ